MVYSLDVNNKPLMPTNRHGKVRYLLKEKKAKIVKREPFTIQLLYKTTKYKQNIVLGVDAGSKFIGLSATTKEKEIYSAEVELRNEITKKLAIRRQVRRSRRNKLRYRQPRFLNRISRKNKGWLAPSIEHKIQTHMTMIKKVYEILPITKIIVETAQFDIQKINNPEIESVEYQQGEQLGFWNVREFVLFRDNHTCQHCKGKSKDKILNVHHIESRLTGGDSTNNLVTLCETCHNAYHKGKIDLKIKRGKKFNHATFMGIMRKTFHKRLFEIYPNVKITYGYITKNTRIENNLEKAHRIDAKCITGNPLAKSINTWFYYKKVRCQNRQIHKSNFIKGHIKKLNQAPFEVKGFRLFDKVEFEKELYYIFGRRKSGFFDIRKLDGTKVNKGSISYKKLLLRGFRETLLIERRNCSLLTTEVASLRTAKLL
ncbi:RNA-guided endonuclease IscB [Clostridiaceae bacterium HSG29]|nr:RNA-guided endonuclease IscB [Clostridiaceae bacterium HSG29]